MEHFLKILFSRSLYRKVEFSRFVMRSRPFFPSFLPPSLQQDHLGELLTNTDPLLPLVRFWFWRVGLGDCIFKSSQVTLKYSQVVSGCRWGSQGRWLKCCSRWVAEVVVEPAGLKSPCVAALPYCFLPGRTRAMAVSSATDFHTEKPKEVATELSSDTDSDTNSMSPSPTQFNSDTNDLELASGLTS